MLKPEEIGSETLVEGGEDGAVVLATAVLFRSECASEFGLVHHSATEGLVVHVDMTKSVQVELPSHFGRLKEQICIVDHEGSPMWLPRNDSFQTREFLRFVQHIMQFERKR